MGKSLRFTKTELTNAARVAIEHGVIIRLDIDGSMIIRPVNNGDSGNNQPEPVVKPEWGHL